MWFMVWFIFKTIVLQNQIYILFYFIQFYHVFYLRLHLFVKISKLELNSSNHGSNCNRSTVVWEVHLNMHLNMHLNDHVNDISINNNDATTSFLTGRLTHGLTYQYNSYIGTMIGTCIGTSNSLVNWKFHGKFYQK